MSFVILKLDSLPDYKPQGLRRRVPAAIRVPSLSTRERV